MIARLGLSLSLSLFVCACWSSNEPSTDSRTSWLSACDSSADCGDGAACVCGICTAACSKRADCDQGSQPAASCAEPARDGVAESCERDARELGGSVCVPRCETTGDCASGWSCVDRVCLPSVATVQDAGAAESPISDAGAGQSDAGAGPADSGTGSTQPSIDDGVVEERLLRATAWEAPGMRCATGGLRALSGIDRNGNGTLDDAEIAADALTCNESRSSDRGCSAAGIRPAAALVACKSGAAGDNCPGDGLRVDDGHDASGDGVLDDGEVESSAYACAATTACDGSTWHELAPGLACCDLAGVDLGRVRWEGVDLTEADLQDASLSAAELQPSCSGCPAVRLNCANLSGTQLDGAKLSGVMFGGADLSRAALQGAVAEGARFENAVMAGADLSDAQASHAKLSYADLTGATLRGVDLRSADLSYADLSGADLTSAKLAGATTGFLRACPASLPDPAWACVSGARPICGQEGAAPIFALIGAEVDLSGANLSGRALAGMKLRAAKLSGADLSGALLDQADLRDADLRGADLSAAELGEADLTGALTDSSTICPGATHGPCW